MNKINNALLALALIAMLCGTASAIYEWEQVNEEGFGDLTNDYAWAMHEYNDYLYVGTLNTNFSDPPSALTDGLEIWRSPSGDSGTWEQVLGPSGTQLLAHPITGAILPARAGFYTGCLGVRGMEVYENLLWVGTSNPFYGCQIWVTNGTHWKRANNPGFGDFLKYNANNTATRGITIFNGEIYAEAQNTKEGAGVWKYTGPTDFDSIGTLVNQSKWVQVNMPGFGEPETNVGIGELIRFDPLTDGKNIEYLYAGTWNISDTQLAQMLLGDISYPVGCQVWRTNGTVDPSESPRLIWEKVMGGGFGDPQNGGITSSAVFNNALYMGTGNLADQAEIWRTTNGIDWEPVTTTGFLESGGFGTTYMWRMTVYKDMLFVGTFNPILGGQVWRSTSGQPHTFEQVNMNGMNGERNIPIVDNGGCTLYGIDQYGVRSFAVFNDDLYLGTASWGDWVDKIAKTDYSKYVGCEVWRTNSTLYNPPEMYVNKTVWDPENHKWVHELDAMLGDTVRFRCEIGNDGPCTLTNIVICDFLSCSLEYAGEATVDPNGLIDCIIGGTGLFWNISTTLESGESVVIEYNATVVKCNCVDKNFLFVVGCCENIGHCGYGWDIAIINGVCPPLNLSKTDDVGDCVDVGGTITYTICYDNPNSAAVHNVVINDTLPAGVNFVSASDDWSYNPSTRTVTWTIGDLSAGAAEACVTLNVTVNTGTEGQTLRNCATIESDETEPTTACEDTQVCTAGPTPTPTPYPTPYYPPGPYKLVPALTPHSMMVMIGLLSLVGSVILRRKR